MRKNLFVLFILVGLAACTSSIWETELPSTPAQAEETATDTFTPSLQRTATGTDIPFTSTPSLTGTFTPFPTPPGLLTREELEQRMQDWISGEIELTDADRLLDEETGEEVRLGMLDSIAMFYTLVFQNLGFTSIEDQHGNPYLINLMGFEDAQGNHFTAVFQNGRLDDDEAVIRLVQWRGRRINREEEQISFEQLPPKEFARICSELPMSVYVGTTCVGDCTGLDAWNRYLIPAADKTQALMNFLMCAECSMEDVPAILESIINSIPEEYSPDIPYFYDYDVSYW
jgi:hypothetical protein